MASSRPSGLKTPSKIGKPSSLPHPKGSSGIPQPGSRAQSYESVHMPPGQKLQFSGALEKSARAAGLSLSAAERYAQEMVKKLPGPEPVPATPPTDDFIIGDRVYVGGTKPGFIAFIGQTSFAPGEWAGIVLDDPIGKNDGSVSGVRYFQCEAKRGVFARLTKISKEPNTDSGSMSGSMEGSTISSTPAKSKTTNGTAAPQSKIGATPKLGLVKKNVSGSQSNLSKASPSGSSASLTPTAAAGASKHSFSTGERVLVSGSKAGVLRYIGKTDFAKGEWAGVELDEALGKNDGAVAGKRYFHCKPMYGLFAPVHKVAKAGGPGTATSAASSVMPPSATPLKRGSISKYGGGSLNRERSGSVESVSSVSSSASSVSRSRVRLGVTSLSSQAAKTTNRPSTLNLSATTSALQKALKEKEEHIEQLLRERDMERSEVARAAAQVDEAESQLATMKSEHDRYMEEMEESNDRFKTRVEQLEKEKSEISGYLEEERRKVEDLQFTIEEEAINKTETENLNEADMARVREMEEKMRALDAKCQEANVRAKAAEDQLAAEKDRIKKLEQDVNLWKTTFTEEKARSKDAEDSSIAHLDQIEELTHKLTMAESKIKGMEQAKVEESSKANVVSEEISKKVEKINYLEEELTHRSKAIAELEFKLVELQEEHTESESKKDKLQDTIDELMKKLAASDVTSSTLKTEVQDLKSQLADLQRQLGAGDERSQQLEEDKSKLEHQISELMKHSGDSSQQLTLINEQLVDKDRKLAELQAALSDSTQKVGKLNETIERMGEERERETEVLLGKHQEDLKSFQERLDEAQSSADKATAKLNKAKEQHEQELGEVNARKDGEVANLKEQLAGVETNLQSQVNVMEEVKANVEQLNTDKENLKFEKEKIEKQLKKSECECEAVTAERDSALVEKQQLLEQQQSVLTEKGSTEERVQKLMAENQALLTEKNKLAESEKMEISAKEKLQHEKDEIARERSEAQASAQEKGLKIQDLQHEVEKLRHELDSQQQKLVQTQQDTQIQSDGKVKQLIEKLEVSQQASIEWEQRYQQLEGEKDALRMEAAKIISITAEKQQLEHQQNTLIQEIEDLKKRESKLLDDTELERSAIQNNLETANLLLRQREKELELVRNELKILQGENALMKSYKTTMQSLEQEKGLLEQRVSQLELTVAESQANANVMSNIDTNSGGDAIISTIQSDKEVAEGQVDFLNSVIVDMQRKNEELTARLQAMESGGVVNGSAEYGFEDDSDSSNRKPAPRLFCDICDMFDVHDTDDCPAQAMSDSPPPSNYHGTRHEERPYCDICEVFGHWTSDCDDEQTF